MSQAEMVCTNELCPAREQDYQERWWSTILSSRRTGATDLLEGDCPECGEPGEATGEYED